MKLSVLICAMALGAPLAALAQSIGEPLPGRKEPYAERRKPVSAERPARPCPEYGPGFVRVEGSSACVRVGGAVRVEFGKSSRSGYGSSAGGRLYLEGRAETPLGGLRTVISTEGRIDRGLDGSSWRYR